MSRLFRRILVPHDFSPQATQALRVAADLAARAKGRLTVVHAIPNVYPIAGLPPVAPVGWYPPPVAPAELIASERRRLEALVARTVSGRGRPRVACRVMPGDPFQCIMDAARGASAIVMSTLGRTGLPHLVLGSVAEKVVRHSPIPVLTIRGRASRKASARPRARRAS
jgi:nucleotide-binding universal stress UspA family protein